MWPAVPIPGQWAYVLGACVLLLLAAGALYRGLRHDRAKGRPRCYKCGYPVVPGNARDVTEAVDRAAQSKAKKDRGWSCPECGWSPKRVKDLTRTRRSRRWLAASLLLALGALLTWYTIHIQYRRLTLGEPLTTAATPTTWWVAMLPHRTGDEDLIVYYRAYPQAKIAGTGARQQQLNGSGRMLVLPPMQYRGREAGWMAIPRWQADFGASRCRSIMQDTTRPEGDRADAVWLYAELSRLDERDEVEAVTTIQFQGNEDLILSIVSEVYDSEIGLDLTAAMLAQVMRDSTYTDSLRELASDLLVETGVEAEPHLLETINLADPELAKYIYWTLSSMPFEFFEDLHAVDAFLLRMYIALLQSPEPELIEVGLDLVAEGSPRQWERKDSFYEMYIAIVPSLELLVIHEEEQVRDRAVFLVRLLAEEMEHFYSLSDLRTIEVCKWVLSMPSRELRMYAAFIFSSIAFHNRGVSESDRRVRSMVRPILEDRLSHELYPDVRRELHFALERLDAADARAARWDAEHAEGEAVRPSEE